MLTSYSSVRTSGPVTEIARSAFGPSGPSRHTARCSAGRATDPARRTAPYVRGRSHVPGRRAARYAPGRTGGPARRTVRCAPGGTGVAARCTAPCAPGRFVPCVRCVAAGPCVHGLGGQRVYASKPAGCELVGTEGRNSGVAVASLRPVHDHVAASGMRLNLGHVDAGIQPIIIPSHIDTMTTITVLSPCTHPPRTAPHLPA